MRHDGTGDGRTATWRALAPLLAAGLILTGALSGCRVGDLVSALPSADTLDVTPSPLDQTMVSGMGDVIDAELEVTPADTGTQVPWVASVVGGGSWLALGTGGGEAPATLMLSLQPGHMSAGRYDATIAFDDSASHVEARVPVHLDLVSPSNAPRTAGCVVLTLLPGTSVTGQITSDCMSTTQPARYARVFQFDGLAGDTVTLSASSSDLGPRISLFAPGDWPGGSTLALVKDCNGSGTGMQACLQDFVLPQDGTYSVEIWPWEMDWPGSFTFNLVERGPRSGR